MQGHPRGILEILVENDRFHLAQSSILLGEVAARGGRTRDSGGTDGAPLLNFFALLCILGLCRRREAQGS